MSDFVVKILGKSGIKPYPDGLLELKTTSFGLIETDFYFS